ncbi:MAG: type II toxin-antitoxin system HipA family toxin [Alteromonadaceae bacterium]|nr:type II toxin-antitoxin system HipA family toxin [Alteromonadaceae bacterium]
MKEKINSINISLWGTRIGVLFWDNNVGYFEYDPNFLNSSIELAPLTMPLKKKTYFFTSLSEKTYKGLPGFLADSLPDKFGNQLIDQWLERSGKNKESFSPAERLCYIGKRGMGGLEFSPTIGIKKEKSYPLQIDELVSLANDALSQKDALQGTLGKDDATKMKAVEHIISVGTSAGGARAKAVIAWNEKTNEIRSGQIPTDEGFSYWLLKFDGINENKDKETLADPKGFGMLEYAYYLMAVDCGIHMTECRLFVENDRSHFMTKRFDRLNGGDKIHMQSLCAMAHFDFNQSGGYSYEQAIGVMRDLRLPHTQISQFYKRMMFNVIACNQDDHTKNIAFLMDKEGVWSLSPAYDITHCNGTGWTSKHQMTVNGKAKDFTQDDLLKVATHANISKAKALEIINDVTISVLKWHSFADKSGLTTYAHKTSGLKNWIEQVAADHRIYLNG